jgi:hypothetical protein
MHIALRRRLRAPLPVTAAGAAARLASTDAEDRLTGLETTRSPAPEAASAHRAHVLEHAWIRVAREGVGPEGRVVPQPRLARTTLGVPADDTLNY